MKYRRLPPLGILIGGLLLGMVSATAGFAEPSLEPGAEDQKDRDNAFEKRHEKAMSNGAKSSCLGTLKKQAKSRFNTSGVAFQNVGSTQSTMPRIYNVSGQFQVTSGAHRGEIYSFACSVNQSGHANGNIGELYLPPPVIHDRW